MRRFSEQLPSVSRRRFIGSTLAVTGGLLIGFRSLESSAQGKEGAAINPLDTYLRIGADDTVDVLCAHMEGGQGIYAGVATLVAEELGADWSKVKVTGAAGNTALYGNLVMGGVMQVTGGSTGLASSWTRYREAGAMARDLLTRAAAEAWDVSASEVQIDKGTLTHPSGRSGSFGEFVERAATLQPPATVSLKPASQWTLIGNKDLRRPDTAGKTRGKQDYTIDVQLPGMVTAVLKRPPRFGGTVKSFDADPVRKMPGIVDVVETPRGIAVVAKDYWQALKGRDALNVEWDETNAETRSSREILDEYGALARSGKSAPVHSTGDVDQAMKASVQSLDTQFEFPYLAHAAMEPLNAVARFDGDQLEIWAGHQLPDYYQQIAAQIAGITPDNVALHVMMTGGFFGRRATPDADVIVEVASVAKAMKGTPVRVQWSREDDMTGGRYRPLFVHRVEAGLDAQGQPAAWRHTIVGQSILGGTPFEMMMRDGIDPSSVEGVDDTPYALPNFSVGLNTTDVGVPVLWWRSVGHTHTAFVMETTIDDLAALASADPYEYRRGLLKNSPRHVQVLDRAVAAADWTTPSAAGRAKGIAVHQSFGTYVAQVVEVSINNKQAVRVEKVICAVDCGTVVNPDVVAAQMEGAIGFALGALLHGEITLEDGVVQQSNYDGFQVLRMNEMPEIEVHIVASSENPTGVGEPGVPPLAPAVSNAIFAATGQRKRSLPIGSTV